MERIGLDNEEFEGRNNAYLLEGDGEVALVDTGIATPETRASLEAGLATAGLGFRDVETVVLTHWHADHAGLAGALQRSAGATVYVHEADAPLVAQDADALDDYETRQRERFERWGMPDTKRDELWTFFGATEGARGEPIDPVPLTDGERLPVAGHDLIVRHSPGHTLGSIRLEHEDDATAFVGDTILPVYTPNIGGADTRVKRPLDTYLTTLAAVADAGYNRVWPGHRDPIDDPAGRAETIIEHHRTRTRRVVDVLIAHGPADAWTVSAHLFGGLEGIHIMHGPGEADAHLEHLNELSIIECDGGTYHPPADDVVVKDVIATHWPT